MTVKIVMLEGADRCGGHPQPSLPESVTVSGLYGC
jgi:hypothetical protein